MGVFSGSADYSETGAALSSLDGCSDAYLVDFAYFEILCGYRSDRGTLFLVSLLTAQSFYSAAWCIYCNFSGKIRRLSAFQKKLVVIADSDSIVSGCYHK